MVTIWIPSLLRHLIGGAESIHVDGETVRQVLENAAQRYPSLVGHLYANGELKNGITIAVDSAVVNKVLDYPVNPDSEMHFVLAISGGSERLFVTRWDIQEY